MDPAPSRRRRILRICGALLLALLLAELGLFAADPWLPRGFYVHDPDLGFRVRAGAGGANTYGFNDRDYPLARRPGTFRMLVLGDSFGWTGGIDGNYTALLEESLCRRLGAGRVEVINAGYPMTQPAEQAALLRKHGLALQPDLVLLSFFTGNDFLDSHPGRRRVVVNGFYLDAPAEDVRVVWGRAVLPFPRLWICLREGWRMRRAREWMRELPGEGQGREVHAAFDEGVFLEIERRRLDICDPALHEKGAFSPQIASVRLALERMKADLDGKRIAFRAAAIPDEGMVSPGLQASLRDRFGLDLSRFRMDLPQALLRAELDRLDVPLLDLTPSFAERCARERLYLERNTHWSAAGHRLAAERLEAWLLPEIEAAIGGGGPR